MEPVKMFYSKYELSAVSWKFSVAKCELTAFKYNLEQYQNNGLHETSMNNTSGGERMDTEHKQPCPTFTTGFYL